MCQAKPGLRCATHARQKVKHYQSKIEEKTSKLAKGDKLPPRQKTALKQSIYNFSKKLEEAQLEYGLTDQGFKEMKEAQKENPDDSALAEKIKEHGLLRRRRKQAYNAYNSTAGFRFGAIFAHSVPEESGLLTPENASLQELEQQLKDEQQNFKALQESLYNKSMSTATRVPGLSELGEKTGKAYAKANLAREHLNEKKTLIRENKTPIEVDNNMSWSHLKYKNGIDYDYDVDYDSDVDEDGEGFSQIVNARITSVNANEFLGSFYQRRNFPKEISDYAETVGLTNPDNWDIEVTGGYYGDEIGDIGFPDVAIRNQIDDKIKSWNYRNYDPSATVWTPDQWDEDQRVDFAVGDKVKVVDEKGYETEGTVSQIAPFKILDGMTETTAVTESGMVNSNILAIYK